MKTTISSAKPKQTRADDASLYRPPLLRSANWAILIGAVAGCIVGITQVSALRGGVAWSVPGGLVGALAGVVAGSDLLIPGPGRASMQEREGGGRIGPFRWGVLMVLLMVEGLIFGAYLWGSVTLTCQQLESEQSGTAQVDCWRTVSGWFGSQQTGETHYDDVIAVNLDVRNELLLQHGVFEQSQSVSGFGEAEVAVVQNFLVSPVAPLSIVSDAWTIRLGAPVCFAIAALCCLWAYFSLRQGLRPLKEQFVRNEVYWGWSRPAQ